MILRITVLLGMILTAGVARAAREMTTDRPDATESPFTVETGRVQIEVSAVSYTRDRHNPERDDTRVTSWNVMPVNVRIGLRPDLELQIISDNYLDVEVSQASAGFRERRRGLGDVTLRVKRNFWGNDGGPSALGLMPFVKIPTNQRGLGNDSIEGGVILPYARDLAPGWSLGAMTEIDGVRNAADNGYTGVWVNTVTIGHEWTERLGSFVELATEVGEGRPVLSFNAGCTYALQPNLQLDFGANFGLNRAASDLTVFTGFSIRL